MRKELQTSFDPSEYFTPPHLKDLTHSRQVLKAVVATRESTVTLNSDINRVGPYTRDDIRQAAVAVFKGLTSSNPSQVRIGPIEPWNVH